MNQLEQTEYLDACQRAFVVFASRFPDYPQTEANAREMARELTASGLRPDNADHLAAVWERLRPKTAPAPQPVLESADPIEAEARALIDSGKISLETINAMSNSAYELASRSAVFCKALEILEPRREPSVLTRGELGAAAGQAALSTDQGILTTTAQKVEELEAWKREHFAKISTAGTPATVAPRSGITNPGRDIPLPKLASEAQFAAAIQRERADQKFLEGARDKTARVRRVKAHRGR
jgi:hypothetical protein